jgi:hypothetical protein
VTAHAATRRVRSTRPVRRQRLWATLFAVAAGSLVSVGLGVYGRTHEPTFYAINLAGFSSGIAAKSWLATGVFVLVVVQLASALVLFGRVPGGAGPSWIGGLHRWSGRAAVLVSVPVAVHCLYALGGAVALGTSKQTPRCGGAVQMARASSMKLASSRRQGSVSRPRS